MRPIFCGNFDYDTRQYDLERLFSKYGRVDRVDIKSGEILEFPAVVFCFIDHLVGSSGALQEEKSLSGRFSAYLQNVLRKGSIIIT